MRNRAGPALCAIALVFASGCAAVPRYDVQGALAGQALSTSTDSELSRYYLEHYLAGERVNPAFDQGIDETLARFDERPLDRDMLQELTQQFSIDFATLYFVSRLYQDPVNRQAQQAFHAHLAALREEGGAAIAARLAPYLIAFVPGYAFRRSPETGADFARQRWLLGQAGVRTHLIETDEIGLVEPNAAIIADDIRRLGRDHDRIILVSTSKGGPEAALALGKLLSPEEVQPVKAWVSIGGMLQGTPSADRWLVWPRRWIAGLGFRVKGLSPDVIANLSTGMRRAAFAELHFPDHLVKLQYIGVPLSGHVGDHIRSRYRRLKAFGPNDGLTLLADQLVNGGVAITDIGLDHYYLDPEIELKTFAMAAVVLDLLHGRVGNLSETTATVAREEARGERGRPTTAPLLGIALVVGLFPGRWSRKRPASLQAGRFG